MAESNLFRETYQEYHMKIENTYYFTTFVSAYSVPLDITLEVKLLVTFDVSDYPEEGIRHGDYSVLEDDCRNFTADVMTKMELKLMDIGEYHPEVKDCKGDHEILFTISEMLPLKDGMDLTGYCVQDKHDVYRLMSYKDKIKIFDWYATV